MQTFSKAWGLAALRLGMVFASKEIVAVLNKIKPPYNVNGATQELALKALENLDDVNRMIQETIQERDALIKSLAELPVVQQVYPTDANFVLVKMEGATSIYNFLREHGIIVRNRSNVLLCDDSLRITVGTPAENRQLLNALTDYKK
jgi:histidinol-phosphate aminotransferase